MGEVTSILKQYGFFKFLNDPTTLNQYNSIALIEKFNKTLLNRIKKYLTYADTLNYVDVLSQLIENYNNTEYSTIQEKPINVFSNKTNFVK